MNQITIQISAKKRGIHLITQEVLNAIENLPSSGILHLFIQHTSAGICINENADPTVRKDLEAWLDRNVKENESYYLHTFEGSDDMPAHIKGMLMGNTVSIPIINSQLALGTWQGIYLGEFRNYGGNRKIIASIIS